MKCGNNETKLQLNVQGVPPVHSSHTCCQWSPIPTHTRYLSAVGAGAGGQTAQKSLVLP